MEIKREIKTVKIQDNTRVNVNAGQLILGVSPDDGALSLSFKSEKGVIHLLCDHFKKLGNINRYAKCYGIEFER